MSKLLKRETLREDNSHHISQIKTSTDSLIATHTADEDAHHEADNYVTPFKLHGFDGFVEFYGHHYTLNSDANARMLAYFPCPQTRTDWQIVMAFNNDTPAETGSGKIYAGAFTHGEAGSPTNIFNAINFDLTTGDANITYKSSSTFSATKNDLVRVQWLKDANEGANFLYVLGMWLYHV